MRRLFWGIAALVCGWLASSNAGAAEGTPEFERQVAPILLRRCVECHHGPRPAGHLDLSRRAGALTGGDSGPALIPGQPADSAMIHRVTAGEMPPPLKGVPQPLPAAEIEILTRWLAGGAKWPDERVLDPYEATTEVRGGRDFWSLQPVKRPVVPGGKPAANPIDAFIEAKRQAEGMTSAPSADKRTLIRRLYNDVVGLPPSFDEIEAFVRDDSPDAWPKLVDRLLDSPHYGERWGRHWLDIVRFAETSGYERDQTKTYAWKYRDYVVAAFNADLPYNRFIVEQLAGDEVPDRTEKTVVATGFLRLGTWNDEPNDPEDYEYDRLEDLVHATSSAFLGLTVKCARCHDHKFDPIPQTDYYRVAAAFWPGPLKARDRKWLGGPTTEELGLEDVLGWTDLTPMPAPLHALKNGERHHPLQVVEAEPASFVPSLAKSFNLPTDGTKTTQRRLNLANWIADAQNPLTPRVLVNRLWLHHFGQGLVRSVDNFGFTGDRPTHPELLDWLAAEFVQGGWKLKPMHRLILTSQTWRQSSLHPQAAVYNRTDAGNKLWWRSERRRLDAESLRDAMLTVSGEIDRRLGGPSFKPTISADALEGLSRKAAAWEASSADEQRRRSLYIFTQRSLLPPLMTTFDLSDTTLPCGQRDVTTVAPQALALLNNEFSHGRAAALARRTMAVSPERFGRITAAWQFALGRRPVVDEQVAVDEYLTRQQTRFAHRRESATPTADSSEAAFDPEFLAWQTLCQVLLNSNEFLYVD
ncbi:MAG TPA: PSD1 and planctomycete cytochrome C domain-containing protein [Planctomycetaceae bacterium]|nr:PSD1 and planctomycete cytochrome C domain-containing protein [Planctomycetaceae bacterium]